MRAKEFIIVEADYQPIEPILANKQQFEKIWVPRFQSLQQRCTAMLQRLIHASSQAEQLKGVTVTVESNEAYVQASPQNRSISVDLTVFWDAPDDVLAFAIGHELGHIALNHPEELAVSPATTRQEELDADQYGIQLAMKLGYKKAAAFKFMAGKKGAAMYNLDMGGALQQDPNSTHPLTRTRASNASQSGFKLSRTSTDQIDQLMTHLAE
jgi:predicted Zn-dependent protease